jgi:hypothetical protein
MSYFKYPRTLHLPFSLHMTTDDKMLPSTDIFNDKEVIVTEKLDGECTSLYLDHNHARSLDSQYHPSRTWVSKLHGEIKHDIPEGWRICGENMYAKHSIHYLGLATYFYVFGIYNAENICLSWDDTKEWCKILNLTPVPELYRGVWDEYAVRACYTGESKFAAEQEGYVVRVADAFHYEDHAKSAAKMVRKNHVQTTQLWMNQPVVPNKLRSLQS